MIYPIPKNLFLENIEEVSGKKPIFYPFDLKRKELLKQVFDAHKMKVVFILQLLKR
jgi:UDP-glucose 4-epimerase